MEIQETHLKLVVGQRDLLGSPDEYCDDRSRVTCQRPSELCQCVPMWQWPGGETARVTSPLGLCLPLLQLSHRPSISATFAAAPTLTFALVIDGAARGHGEKTEGIESSPKEEDCEGP